MLLGIIQKQKMYANYLQQLYQRKSHIHFAVPMWAKQTWQPLLQCEHQVPLTGLLHQNTGDSLQVNSSQLGFKHPSGWPGI